MSQRGNIDYDQIAELSRHGDGSQLQMFGGGETTAGHVAIFDANRNVIDGGSPATSTPSGTHSEVLVDHLGSPIPTSSGDWIYVLGVPN